MENLFLSLSTVLYCLGAASAGSVTLDDVVAAQLKYFNSIQSLDYEFTEALDTPEGGSPMMGRHAQSFQQVGRVRVKGSMWRGDAGTDAASEAGGYRETHAYDGKIFQRFDNGDLYYRRDSMYTMPFGFVPPTLRPFAYCYNDVEQEGYSALKEETTWRKCFESTGAILHEERQQTSGHDCLVLELKPPAERALPEDDVRFYVYLATDANLFPVRIEVKSLARNKFNAILEVKSLEQVRSETGELVWMPMAVELQSWGRTKDNNKPPHTYQLQIDKASLRINGDIDDREFLLEPTHPKHFLDEDFPEGPGHAPREVLQSLDDSQESADQGKRRIKKTAAEQTPQASVRPDSLTSRREGRWPQIAHVWIIAALAVGCAGISLFLVRRHRLSNKRQ
jgi:hypothetical protein